MTPTQTPEIGTAVTCAETGEHFTVARDGCSFNCATTPAGEILSDKGVDLRQRRGLLNRTKPFYCYLSGDGKTVTGWKGNVMGHVTRSSASRTGWHGSSLTHVRVTDVHGGKWYGKGAGRGMCITLRPVKGA